MIRITGELIFSIFKKTFMHKQIINIALSCLAIFLMTTTVHAQLPKPGITLGGNLLYAKPKGSFNQAYQLGVGGEVFGGIGMGKTFVVATAGFSEFKTQSDVHSGTLKYTPVKIGLKQFLLRKLIFINADLGRATVKNKTFNESRFTRGIGVGAKLLGLEACLYYDGWKNVNASGFSNSLNVKVGWSLSL